MRSERETFPRKKMEEENNMKQMWVKKMMQLMLALVLMLSAIPVPAFAAKAEVNGKFVSVAKGVGDPLPFRNRDCCKRFSLENFVLDLRKVHLDELLSKQPHEQKAMGREAAHQTYTKCLATKKAERESMPTDEAVKEGSAATLKKMRRIGCPSWSCCRKSMPNTGTEQNQRMRRNFKVVFYDSDPRFFTIIPSERVTSESNLWKGVCMVSELYLIEVGGGRYSILLCDDRSITQMPAMRPQWQMLLPVTCGGTRRREIRGCKRNTGNEKHSGSIRETRPRVFLLFSATQNIKLNQRNAITLLESYQFPAEGSPH